MRLTRGATAMLEAYFDEVRGSLAGKPGVRPEDVVAGIREHVEAELGHREAGPASAEDVAEVLERLGAPREWIDAESDPLFVEGASSPHSRWPELAALGCVGAGGGLVLMGALWGLGWGLLVAGAVLARVAIGSSDDMGSDPLRRLVLLVWWVAAVAAGLTILLAPAMVCWGAAQVGGFLERWLVDWLGITGRPRPPRYWGGTAVVAGMASGIWWVFLAGVVFRASTALGKGLGPASVLAPGSSPRVLGVSGACLIVISFAGALLL